MQLMGKLRKKTWPTLYKKSSKGKIEQWVIQTVTDDEGTLVRSTYGEMNGKQQIKSYVVTKGKNLGKKNETTFEEQANTEALSKWEHKKSKGYVEDLEDAKNDIEDESIKGGINVMLAHDYDDHKDKVIFPCYVQPKLDGMRCIVTRIDGHITLWSRGRKKILSCPHIISDAMTFLASIPKRQNLFLDGELYLHEYSDDFEKIMEAVKKQHPTKESEKIQLHLYDMGYFDTKAWSYEHRIDWLDSLPDYAADSIKVVPTKRVYSEAMITEQRNKFENQGYEGLMIRRIDSVYEPKRTTSLLKYKIWKDDEFDIVNVVGGKDGSVIFVCKTKDGEQFKATKTGNKKENQKYLKRSVLWVGKKVNVRYFKMTKKNNVPKFGQARYIRDEE